MQPSLNRKSSLQHLSKKASMQSLNKKSSAQSLANLNKNHQNHQNHQYQSALSRKFSLQYLPEINLQSHNFKSARNLAIKTIQDSHSAGISRIKFLTGQENDDEQDNFFRTFPRWMSDHAIKHLIKSCVKHEDSYVVFLKSTDQSVPTNSTSDVSNIRQDALKDDNDAQFMLGLMYLDGDGVEGQDAEEALKWLQKSAKHGDVNAQLIVGKLLHEGRGVPKNDIEAHKWLEQAAENNNSEAQFILSQMYLDGDGDVRDIEQAFRWLKESAKNGDPNAQLTIGNLLYEGKLINKDVKTAANLIKRAAKQNNIHAQMIISDMYSKGEGVWKSDKKALKWIKRAAEQDNADAQFILGRMYAKGRGVDQDTGEALKWFRKAAEQGHYEAGIISDTFA